MRLRTGIFALLTLLASRASAENTAPDPQVDRAREAFVLGTALANQGQWPDALSAFERSSLLRPHPVTTYDIAYSERALGHYTRAYRTFRRALAEHDAATTGTLPPDLLAQAQGYLREVEARLVRVRVTLANVGEPPSASLSVDDRPLEPLPQVPDVLIAGTSDAHGSAVTPGARFSILVDPGRHVFVLSTPGAPDKVVAETFESGATRELTLVATVPALPVTAAPAPVLVPARDRSGEAPDRTWAYVAYGIGGAGLVTSAIFGVLTVNQKSYLDDPERCPTRTTCKEQYRGDIDAMNRDAAVATVGLGVAIAGAAAGTFLLLDARPKASTSSIQPWVGPLVLGARGRF